MLSTPPPVDSLPVSWGGGKQGLYAQLCVLDPGNVASDRSALLLPFTKAMNEIGSPSVGPLVREEGLCLPGGKDNPLNKWAW